MSAIFKSVYRNYGIYWHGKHGYGDETSAWCDTMAEYCKRIDTLILAREAGESAKFTAARLKGYRDGDNARIELDGAPVFTGTMRQARQQVFTIEDETGCEIVWQS